MTPAGHIVMRGFRGANYTLCHPPHLQLLWRAVSGSRGGTCEVQGASLRGTPCGQISWQRMSVSWLSRMARSQVVASASNAKVAR